MPVLGCTGCFRLTRCLCSSRPSPAHRCMSHTFPSTRVTTFLLPLPLPCYPLSPGQVHYYQGLHDVAGVLLLALMPPAHPSSPATPPAEPSRPQPQPPANSAPHAHTAPTQHPSASPASPSTQASSPPASTSTEPHQHPHPATDDVGSPESGSDPDPASQAAELLAFSLLRSLAVSHLRDATRPTLEPVVQLLGLLPYALRAADPPLARHVSEVGLAGQPFFALAWFLTWWSREVEELHAAARLFDFFVASHPLMPLYLGAVAMRHQRQALLAVGDMPELHSALTNMKLPGAGGGQEQEGGAAGGRRGWGARAGVLDVLVRQAEQLWRAKPPEVLLAAVARPLPPAGGLEGGVLRRRAGAVGRRGGGAGGVGQEAAVVVLTSCVAHAARLEGATWRVPEEPPGEWPPAGAGAGGGLVRQVLSRALGGGGYGGYRGRLISSALIAGVYVAAAAAVAIGYVTMSRGGGGGGVEGAGGGAADGVVGGAFPLGGGQQTVFGL